MYIKEGKGKLALFVDATIDPNMGFAHLSKGNYSSGETVQTKYGETPVGSFLCYQVSFTESNLSAEAHLNFSTPK